MRRTSNIKKQLRQAFTLVEILIVVVILGILAAIVVPQFTKATDDARGGNLKAQLNTLQNQIELYAARNSGEFPDFSGTAASGNNWNWGDLVTDDYIKEVPKNPAAGSITADAAKSVTEGATGTGIATHGWFFNTTSNTIYASFYNESTDTVSSTGTD